MKTPTNSETCTEGGIRIFLRIPISVIDRVSPMVASLWKEKYQPKYIGHGRFLE
jgi:hypothetical protein